MKKYISRASIPFLTLVLVVSFTLLVSAETVTVSYNWGKHFGGTGNDAGVGAVTTLSDGSTITTGTYTSASVNFNPDGSDVHTGNGNTDVYLTKWNKDGTYAWTKTFGGTAVDGVDMQPIKIDSDDNIILAGSFNSASVNFNPDGSDIHTNNGGSDVFISKWNKDGVYQWTKTFGGSGNERPAQNGVLDYSKIDDSTDIYIAGDYTSASVNFNPDGSDVHTNNGSAGTSDTFITKWNKDGVYQWTKTFGGTGRDWPTSAVAYHSNAVYVLGYYNSSSVNFNPDGSDVKSPVGDNDVFLSKWNADGTYQWTKSIGGTDYEEAHNLGVDENENVFIAGHYYSSSVNFNPNGSDVQIGTGSGNIFISRWNADGSYGWTRTLTGSGYDESYNFTVSQQGDVYTQGYMSSPSLNFNPTGSDVRSPSGFDDQFLTKWNADGSYGWTRQLDNATGYTPHSLNTDQDGDVYWTGAISGVTNFATDGTDNKTGTSFITKWNTDGTYGWTKTWDGPSGTSAMRSAVTDDGYVYVTMNWVAAPSVIDINPDAGVQNETNAGSADGVVLQLIQVFRQHITQLNPGLDAIEIDVNTSVEPGNPGVPTSEQTGIRLTYNGLPLADVLVDFSTDRDWSGVTGSSHLTSGMSFVNGLDSAPGVIGDLSLYVPRLDGYDAVGICPDVTALSQLNVDCSGFKVYVEADSNVELVTIDGQEYWVVSGLDDAGGFNNTIPPPSLAQTGAIQKSFFILGLLLVLTSTVLKNEEFFQAHYVRS
ncbi:MAG: hypothetical protein M3P98_02220 [bacterium]|nr:hypothetical protein [bacterium]